MAAPVDTLEGKVEYALLAQLSDAGLEEKAKLVCGHEFEEQDGNLIAIICFGGEEMVYNSGNYLMRTRIEARTPADRRPSETTVADPREVHREIVQLIRNALFIQTIEAELSAHESDFTVNLFIPKGSDQSVEGRFLVTTMEFAISCVRAW
jgi:hypothetical protein